MRMFLIFIMLAAGGAGYVYLQQPPAPGEPYDAASEPARRVDWEQFASSKLDAAQGTAKELVSRIHEQTRSVLDKFASQHGGHSDAPNDDAFTRLRQVARSAVVSAVNVEEKPSRIEEAELRAAQSALPDFEKLQRIAFGTPEEAVEEPVSNPVEQVPSNEVRSDESRSEEQQKVDSQARNMVAAGNAAAEASASTLVPTATKQALESVTTVSTTDPSQAKAPSDAPVARQASPKSEVAPAAEKPTAVPASRPLGSSEATSSTSKKPLIKKVAARTENPYLKTEWKVVGKTTEGRPMHSMHLGDRGTRTLIIAGLNGEDRTAVRWLEMLAEELKRRPDLIDGNEFVFFRAGNPDGLVRNVRNNVRGVPIYRNFPSKRYRPVPDMPRYAVPASELETRVILDTLYSFRPRRVVHLTSTNGRSLVTYNKSAKALAEELERSAKLEIQPLDVEQVPGSLEDFSDGTLEAAVLSTRLSVSGDWKKAWSKLSEHELAAIVGQPIEVIRGEVTEPDDPDRSPIPPPNIDSISRRKKANRGYEELPPPPGR